MKKNIHPIKYLLNLVCSCGENICIYSTLKNSFSIDVCYKCHSFYTGKQKISSIKGRIENLKRRFEKINFKY